MVDHEPNTLGLDGNEYSHAVTLALVLVEDDAVAPGLGADPQPTAGYSGSNTVDQSRRFVELPTGTYDTTVTVTITENLTGQPTP